MDLPSPQAAATRLKKVSRLRPKLAIVLGSGFHHVLPALRADKKISYAKIPGFLVPDVSSHSGELYFGKLGGTPVLVLSGRAHFYKGHTTERVTFPTQALAAFGIRDLLLTNAAGGINKNFRTGDFMALTDHINWMGVNPLRGEPVPGRPRFVDMTRVYNQKLSTLLFRAGKSDNLKLRRGVYLAVSGPSYETPAEIRAFARLGAHEHGAGGNGGTAMRIERGGGFLHHKPGGRPGQRQSVAFGRVGNRKKGEAFGSGIAEKFCRVL